MPDNTKPIGALNGDTGTAFEYSFPWLIAIPFGAFSPWTHFNVSIVPSSDILDMNPSPSSALVPPLIFET